MSDVLFQDEDIIVRTALAAGAGPVVITFSPHGYRDFDQGWGESFFSKRGFDGVYVISRTHNWFQAPGMVEACRRINERLGKNRDVMTYGSSMGAHAALAFSGPLRASRVLAASPQFGIRGLGGTPWTPSWYEETEGYSNLHTLEAGLSRTAKVYVIYDPLDRFDLEHIRKIEEVRSISAIRAVFTGHNTTSALNRANVLGPIVLGVLTKTAALSDLRQKVRSMRRRNVTTLIAADEKLESRPHHRATQAAIRQRALELAMEKAFEGLEKTELAACLEAIQHNIISAHRAGDDLKATALVQLLRERFPNRPHGLNAEKLLGALKGDWQAAYVSAQRALKLAKKDLYLRFDVLFLALKTGDKDAASYHAAILKEKLESVSLTKMEGVYVAAARRLDDTPEVRSLAATLQSGKVKRRKSSRSSTEFLGALEAIAAPSADRVSRRRAARAANRAQARGAPAEAAAEMGD